MLTIKKVQSPTLVPIIDLPLGETFIFDEDVNSEDIYIKLSVVNSDNTADIFNLITKKHGNIYYTAKVIPVNLNCTITGFHVIGEGDKE